MPVQTNVFNTRQQAVPWLRSLCVASIVIFAQPLAAGPGVISGSMEAQTIHIETSQAPNAPSSTAADSIVMVTFHNTTHDSVGIPAVGMDDPMSVFALEVRDGHGKFIHRKSPPPAVPQSTPQAHRPSQDLKPGDVIPPDDPELRNIRLYSSRFIFVGPDESNTFKFNLRDLFDLSKASAIDVVVYIQSDGKRITQSNSLHLKLAK